MMEAFASAIVSVTLIYRTRFKIIVFDTYIA